MTELSNASQKNHQTFLSKLKLLIPVLLLGVLGVVAVPRLLHKDTDQGIQLSGRIEGYETDVGIKVGGEIQMISVREGDSVRKGQLLAQLDSAELQASLNGAEARISAARQQVNQSQLQTSVIESQIEETQLALLQAQDDARGRVNAAKAGVASATAQLAQAEAQVKQLEAEVALARADRDRFEELFDEGVVSQQRFEQAQTQFESLRETLEARRAFTMAAQEQVKTAQGNLTQSGASELNPDIRLVQTRRLQTQLAQAQAQLKASQAELQNAQANYEEIKARLEDLTILSPIDGVVLTRTTEPGEVVASGQTILTLVNLGDIYMRGYIPEEQVGAIQIGQAAQVFLDSAPDEPLSARVTAIDTEASFTPENIYFRDDRVTQVFGLKLAIDNADNFAKPGMPADAEILFDGS